MTQSKKWTWMMLKENIHTKILNGTYAPDDKLPKDADLAQEYGCSRSTIQRAMSELSHMGVVDRRRKGGTCVVPLRETRAMITIPIISKEIAQQGKTHTYKILHRAIAIAPAHVLAGFKVPAATKMLHLQSVHFADNVPYIYEDRWVNFKSIPAVLDVDFSVENANEWLVKNRPYSDWTLSMHAINAPQDIAQIMHIGKDHAILVIERFTWHQNTPVTAVKLYTHSGYSLNTQG